MHIYSWVIVIALLIVLGLVLKRTWLAQQESVEASEALAAAAHQDTAHPDPLDPQSGFATRLTNTVRNRVQGLRNGVGGKAPQDVATQFRDWASGAFNADPEIQEWLATLSDEQITALAEHLDAFCHDMGFELSWLLDRQIEQNPALLQGLAQIALAYSRASYQAVTLQEEVETFRIYYSYMQNPKSRANRELGEHLFGKLVEQGMSSVSISEHLAASARKRQQQVLETIQQTAVEHPQRFNTALKMVLIERTMPEAFAESVAMNGTAEAPVAAAD